jgi:hypothetical protein
VWVVKNVNLVVQHTFKMYVSIWDLKLGVVWVYKYIEKINSSSISSSPSLI